MAKAQVGDILRAPSPEGEGSWFIVQRVVAGQPYGKCIMGSWSSAIDRIPSSAYHPPEGLIPDEVWAALAVWRLTS